ncbi:10664_t:CDS:2 [Diversispora eburnea]|uniref:10664_t:CDS:1 n=1 Tax=Diversispora eburnea TaxID=1213867 RepID=A0A9N8W195_9GLOM|nr:10664_t:CDS:2 [Diversispora eburnea]
MSTVNDNVISTQQKVEEDVESTIVINNTPSSEDKETIVNIISNDQRSSEPAYDEFKDNSKVPNLSYLQIFILFLDFGIHAWGGPVAQIALFKERIVEKGQWITMSRFNRAFGVYQILPGPEATEFAMYFGQLAGGRFGGLLGGLGFILPGFVLILLFSYIYEVVGFENDYFNASFRALQPIVAAFVLRAVHKIAEHSFISSRTNKFNNWLFGMAILSSILTALNLNMLITMGVCGISFMFIDRKLYLIGILVLVLEFVGFGIFIGLNHGIPSPTSIGIGIARQDQLDSGHIFGLGLLTGSISFGGAYTTIPFLKAEAVNIGGWMTAATFLDAIAIGNILPSPLVMFSCFIGFQAGLRADGGGIGWAFLYAFLITVGVFTPCFLFTIIGHPLLEKLCRNKFMASFFEGIVGSVVGLIAPTAFDLLRSSLITTGAISIKDETQRNFIALQRGAIAAALYIMTDRWSILIY